MSENRLKALGAAFKSQGEKAVVMRHLFMCLGPGQH